jgi:type I restriction enzyme S subunit
MMNITSVKRIHQSDWTDSGVRFLRARDIVAASKNEEPDDYLYISEEKYEEYSALSGKVDINDLLVTGVGTIGVPYLVENLEPLYFKDGNIIWFQNKNKIDGKFLYYSFIGNGIQSFIKASAGTGTVGTYTIDTGKKTPIQIPSKEEQRKIGEYLTNIDHLITLHQSKIDKLKNLKKAMLEKMFPKKGSVIPEIRFNGFANAWEQRKLGDVCEVTMGQSPEGYALIGR